MCDAETVHKENFCLDASEDKRESLRVPRMCLSYLKPDNFRTFQMAVLNFFAFEISNKISLKHIY